MTAYAFACGDYPGMEGCPGKFQAETEDELNQLIETHARIAPTATNTNHLGSAQATASSDTMSATERIPGAMSRLIARAAPPDTGGIKATSSSAETGVVRSALVVARG